MLINNMKIEKVVFNPEGESISALYIDNNLYTYGDEYHDKISSRIDGFLDCLKYLHIKYEYVIYEISYNNCEDIIEQIEDIPKNWNEGKHMKIIKKWRK